MTHLKQAIVDAVEKGGYQGMGWKSGVKWIIEHQIPHVLLDPFFWQAIGRARGWDEGGITAEKNWQITYSQNWMWAHQWHRLISHLVAGKGVESFFATL